MLEAIFIDADYEERGDEGPARAGRADLYADRGLHPAGADSGHGAGPAGTTADVHAPVVVRRRDPGRPSGSPHRTEPFGKRRAVGGPIIEVFNQSGVKVMTYTARRLSPGRTGSEPARNPAQTPAPSCVCPEALPERLPSGRSRWIPARLTRTRPIAPTPLEIIQSVRYFARLRRAFRSALSRKDWITIPEPRGTIFLKIVTLRQLFS